MAIAPFFRFPFAGKINCPDGLATCGVSDVVPTPTTLPPVVVATRVALYGGGAGVDAGLAVLGGGNGGNDVFDVLKNGFPYVAR